MPFSKQKIQFIFLLFFLTFGQTQLSWAALSAEVTIPFKLINGLIILEVEVDGVSGAYLLDTGADAILLDGISTKKNHVLATTHGEVAMSSKMISNIKIGAFEQQEINAHIVCLATLKKQLGLDLHGIIGGGYFMPNALTMDFVKSTITISPSTPDKTTLTGLSSVPFKMINQVPIVEIELEGKTFAFAMDSGATVHFIGQEILPSLHTEALETESTVLTVNNVALSKKRFVVSKFNLGGTNYSGHHFLSQDFSLINVTLEVPIAGILSLSKLVRTKVIFDFEHQTLYFK